MRPALERSLADLGLAYLDLYLIHWPVAHRHGVMMPQEATDQLSLEQRPIAATWRAMEELVRSGLVRHIGVSNFSQAKLAALLAEADLAPEVNQVERHPYLQQPELLAFCQANAIQLTAYAPLGSPPAGSTSPLLSDPVISAIAAAHCASVITSLLQSAISVHLRDPEMWVSFRQRIVDAINIAARSAGEHIPIVTQNRAHKFFHVLRSLLQMPTITDSLDSVGVAALKFQELDDQDVAGMLAIADKLTGQGGVHCITQRTSVN